MSKLTIGEYTKEQLFNILGTTHLNNITRDLTKQGYKYTTNKRKGSNYRLTVTSVPSTAAVDIFRNVCKDELGITENLDYTKLAILISFMAYDTRFTDLTLDAMEKRVKACGFTLCRDTIAKYLDILKQKDMISYSYTHVYYIPLSKGTKFITREQWLEYWNTFFNGDYIEFNLLKESLGGRPYKRTSFDYGNALVPCCNKLTAAAADVVKEIRQK